MTIEHNVIVVSGMECKAVKSKSVMSCEDCCISNACVGLAMYTGCTAGSRRDNTSVIFKRHYRPTHKELQK